MISRRSHKCHVLALVGLTISILISLSVCVDKANFKTCSQSGFCRRHRDFKPTVSTYVVNFDSLEIDNGHVHSLVTNQQNSVIFTLDLYLLKDNRLRFRFNELKPLRKRFEVENVVIDDLSQDKFAVIKRDANLIELKSEASDVKVIMYSQPFKLEFYIGDYLISSFNSRHLLKFEHQRVKDVVENVQEASTNETTNQSQDNEPDMWEETFKGHTDSKPYGPQSIGLDISFHDFLHVYGIPEHADSFSLKSTTGKEPYRLYNLDVFEYELDSPMALYGAVPYMIAHNQKFTVGLLWLNAAETWIDVTTNIANKGIFSKMAEFITKSNEIPQVDTHWISESGVIDVYILLGPKPRDVFRQYGKLVGNTPLPPLFSIAYHQCRWNYNDEQDVKNVNAGFEEHQIPMDVIWLDIEHTDGKRYFTWDPNKFPTPEDMVNHVASYGRKMVTIVDPHIKVDNNYHIYTEAKDRNFYIKTKDGANAEGWCWPGTSSWPDFLNEEVREWWSSKFLLENYKGTTLDVYTWNDMNEPSVFNGPEITFHKDVVHLNGYEHRDVHNIYGQMQVRATYKGHLDRSKGEKRPFILSRSFFAGSQRFGAVWTGDNAAEWGHLQVSIPMLLSLSVSGLSFSGADVGGFFKNVDAELLVRWYQAGAYQPFFRSHAHLDTKRREPWLFGDQYTHLIREAIHSRYSLLYYWYTLFYQNEKNGVPPMLPLWVEFPDETNLYSIDDQHMVGPAIMVKPILTQGASTINVYFPGKDELWYDCKAMKVYEGQTTKIFTDISLSTVPVFQRGGHIVPFKFRLRRSSSQMLDDPFTLLVTLNKHGSANGELYFDDSTSFEYKKSNALIYRKFKFENNKLTSINLEPKSKFSTQAWLERVIVYGYKQLPKVVTIEYANNQSSKLEFTYDEKNKVVLIRKPGINIDVDFTIIINH